MRGVVAALCGQIELTDSQSGLREQDQRSFDSSAVPKPNTGGSSHPPVVHHPEDAARERILLGAPM
jgi:hypothetical protein